MVRKTIIPIILGAVFLSGGKVYANSSYEYTPVMPRVNGHRIYIDDRGLEKYSGITDREFNGISRENIENGINGYLEDENGSALTESDFEGFISPMPSLMSLPTGVTGEDADNNGNESLNENILDDGAPHNNEAENNIDTTNEAPQNNNTPDYTGEQYNNNANISNEVTVKQELINSVDEISNYKVNGELPQITNIKDAAFIKSINEKIEESYLSLVRAGYRNINVEFDSFTWGNITSLVIRYRIDNGKETVKTFVFDSISQREVTLRQLLGKDYMEYINRFVSEKINKGEIGVYYAGLNKFQSIAPSQNFYIKDGDIVIVFDQGVIGPSSTGTPEFRIPLESLSITISSREYEKRNGITYIPVSVATRLGMSAELKEGGILEITPFESENTKRVNVNNNMVNSDEVIYINGYNIGLSADYMSSQLSIIIESAENSKDLTISYLF